MWLLIEEFFLIYLGVTSKKVGTCIWSNKRYALLCWRLSHQVHILSSWLSSSRLLTYAIYLSQKYGSSLIVVSGSRVRILGKTLQLQGRPRWHLSSVSSSPEDAQNTALLLVSAYILSSGHCGVLVLCLVILSDVIRFWLLGAILGVSEFLAKLLIHV